jgi:hypothetical protein
LENELQHLTVTFDKIERESKLKFSDVSIKYEQITKNFNNYKFDSEKMCSL